MIDKITSLDIFVICVIVATLRSGRDRTRQSEFNYESIWDLGNRKKLFVMRRHLFFHQEDTYFACNFSDCIFKINIDIKFKRISMAGKSLILCLATPLLIQLSNFRPW